MGKMVSEVAHDFNNLLTPILRAFDTLHSQGGLDSREMRLIESGLQATERARSLVQRLLAFARRQPVLRRVVELGPLVTGLGDLLSSMAGPSINLVLDIHPDLPAATIDLNQLEMTILNLATNARDAMPAGGTLTITLASDTVPFGHKSDLIPGEYLRLSVADTGTGMDTVTLSRARDPFFSTKEIGVGTGLGLSMAEGLASQLGGALFIASALGIGTTVEIWLPAAADLAIVLTRPPASSSKTVMLGRVLLVDDEPEVRMCIAEILVQMGYEVVEAGSAPDALFLLDQGGPFDLLITDHVMPGQSGADLIRIVKAKRPGLPALIITGFAEADTIPIAQPRLAKPLRPLELAARLQLLN